MNIIAKENNKPTIKTEAAAPAPHPSIMINRVGIHNEDQFTATPTTFEQMCAYFSRVCRLPHQTISGDTYTSMKKNAEDWYSNMTEEQRKQLAEAYNNLDTINEITYPPIYPEEMDKLEFGSYKKKGRIITLLPSGEKRYLAKTQ